MVNVVCAVCGKIAYYLSRTTKEPMCSKCIQIDEQINFQKGRIDKYGNELNKKTKS